MRDKIMDEKYFEEYIMQQQNRINKFSAKLNKGEVKEDRILSVLKKIDSLKYSIFEAKYSKGDDLKRLRAEFIDVICNIPKYWNSTSGFVDILSILSIAIMFEIDGNEWNDLSQAIYDIGINDWLLGYLLASRDGNRKYCNWEVKMKNPYGYLKDIIIDSQNKKEDLQKFLENKWYDAHKEMAWYDIHKSKEKLYSGYWSYEAGAVAKILNIDDSSLENILYYPYDLVHYKNNM